MYKYLFGPVPSRRLGVSLGVDLVPKKVCSLDCVYCEVGKTTKLSSERLPYIPFEKLTAELEDFMSKNPEPDYMTLTGSGEPTLNSRFGDIVNFIKSNYPQVKTSVLTNGTLLHDPQVRRELSRVDLIMPSLDAAGERAFRLINRPDPEHTLERHIQGLIDLRREFNGPIWLEVLLLKGYNDDAEELARLKEAILEINPDSVQLNTLDRPGIIDDLLPLSHAELQQIADDWALPRVEIIARPKEGATIGIQSENVSAGILQTIARRPCTLADLQQIVGLHADEIQHHLNHLEAEGTIRQNRVGDLLFYELSDK